MVIDGKTVLDEQVTPGQKTPPAILAEMIKAAPNGKRQPSMMAAAAALADAVMAGKSVQITIDNHPNNEGWTLTVNYVAAFNPATN